VTWEQLAFPNQNFTYVVGTFPPHISKFVSPSADAPQKAALLIPNNVPAGKKLKLRAHFDGYSAAPDTCYNNNFSSTEAIVTRNCPDHYGDPDMLWGGVGGWGGPSEGENPYGWRIAATLKYASDHYNSIIDWGAGWTAEGCSYGGTTSILQSLIMPDKWAKATLTNVVACVPQTLMVEPSDPVGQYWVSQSIRTAWGGYDYHLADVRTQATGRVRYRVNGSPLDTSVRFDLRFFPWVCDDKRIPCMGTWHAGGHNPTQAGINLPFMWEYSDTGMEHRLDQPQVAFLHSSANYMGNVGHWNLGLAWWNAGMVDTSMRTLIPLRYVPWKNIGGGAPDQPSIVTFGVTVRNTKMPLGIGDRVLWSFGMLSGMATVTTQGEVTLEGLSLPASSSYTGLELWK
jgi:hypothetical protein